MWSLARMLAVKTRLLRSMASEELRLEAPSLEAPQTEMAEAPVLEAP